MLSYSFEVKRTFKISMSECRELDTLDGKMDSLKIEMNERFGGVESSLESVEKTVKNLSKMLNENQKE